MQTQTLQNRLEEAQALTESLLESRKISFQELVPSMLEDKPGVYAIFDRTTGKTLYNAGIFREEHGNGRIIGMESAQSTNNTFFC